MTRTLTSLFVIALASPVAAQEPPPPAEPPVVAEEPPVVVVPAAVVPEPPAFAVGLKLGVVLPQVATELGPAPTGSIELSYAMPFAQRRVGIYLEAAYAQPSVERSGIPDPRVPGDAYDGTQTQRELIVGLGFVGRVAPPRSVWNGYGMLGGRAYFLETLTVGSAGGAEFGENREQSARFGGMVTLGGERLLGPGVLALEAGFGTSDLPHLITGDVSTGAIAIQIGYRLFF